MILCIGIGARARRAALVILSSSIACAHSQPLVVSTMVTDQHGEMQSKPLALQLVAMPPSTVDSVRIRIRCGSSIDPNHPPLWVLDGVALGLHPDGTIDHDAAANGMQHIDPKSISYVEVLKPVAAVKRFGPGAHQGAILITTTKSKAKSP